MYHATKDTFKEKLAGVARAPLPLLHLGADGWTSKISKDKFLGVRATFVLDGFKGFASCLLAVKHFRPDKQATAGQQSSDVQLAYIKQVLDEYTDCGASTRHVAGSTSDAGPDIRRLCDKLLPGAWDWCICHLINAALADACGTSQDPKKSKNPQTRTIIHKMRKVIESLVSNDQLDLSRTMSWCVHANTFTYSAL
jgi:hypothetical protein